MTAGKGETASTPKRAQGREEEAAHFAPPEVPVGERTVSIPDPALKDPFADLLANLKLPEVGPHDRKTAPASPDVKAVPSPPAEMPAPSPPAEKLVPAPPTERPVPAPPADRPAPLPPVGMTMPAPPAEKERKEEGRVEKKVQKEEKEKVELHVPPAAPPSPEAKPPKVILPPGFFRKPEPQKGTVAPQSQPAEKRTEDLSAFLPKPILLRSTYPLEPEDVLYLHAVAQIPVEEKPAHEPFILEEKGIETKEFVFALDRGGLRFYLSRLTGKTTNVSKTGMLLLNRKESIHLRGTHYSILNDLRVYGLLLPFEFGSVAIGIDDLHTKIDEHVYELRDALEEIVATKWWEVCVYGLDQKMMQFVAPDGPTQRGERDRRGGDRGRTTGSRIDIKTLERVLNKQKSLAEEIHHRLENLSARSDVDMMVNLSSGSSDDWKPILRASYDVASPAIYRFNHAINDLQYHHLKYQLMFVLTGDREDYSFQQG